MALLDAAAARAGDEAAVEGGATWSGLMERAAGHLARGVIGLAGYAYGLKVAVVVGKGNNGGDGWAAARRLHDLGASCWVIAPAGTDTDASDEAAENRRRWIEAGGRTSGGLDDLDRALGWADVAVDCLLGTGISGAPRGIHGEAAATLVAQRQRDGLPVVACDIPSGVSSDDGSAPDGAVRADLTVTFGGYKRGLLLHPGADHAGRVVLGELGPAYAPPPVDWAVLTAAGAAPPPLATDADKLARGVVLAVAGSVGKAGAAVLCTRGILELGAGLTTLACPAHIQRVVAPIVPSAMTLPLRHQGTAVSADAVDELSDLDRYDAVVAGPGLTPVDGTRAVVDHLLAHGRRVVLDADAINVYRDDPATLADHGGALIVTPHERELARIVPDDLAEEITGTPELDGPTVWAHRTSLAPALAARLDATVVVKGPGTIVAAPDGRVWVTPTGGPGLGVGGSGDVLAGMVAAAVAGVAGADDVPLAVARAVWWHGFAGDLLGASTADRASSQRLATSLPAAMATLADVARTDPSYPLELS